MAILKWYNKSGKLLKIKIAASFWQRFCGLMLTQTIEENQALLIRPCNSIHMMFMRYPIDAVYLDDGGRILKIVTGLKPWLGMSVCLRAGQVLEMAAGAALRYNMQVGDILQMEWEVK